MSRRSFNDATDSVGKFDRQKGIHFYAMLLNLRGDMGEDGAMEEYSLLILDLWLYVRDLLPSVEDMQKMCEYAAAWCLRRYSES